jgi:phosphoglycolate phosphatase-like HAD superfamily hydrolase
VSASDASLPGLGDTNGTVAGVRRLLLWDIDLTLVDLQGIGADWYAEALATVTGTTLREAPRFQGRTEWAITAEVLATHGYPASGELLRRMWQELVAICTRTHRTFAGIGRALPGAAAALAAVARHGGAVQSLVTGNLPEVARLKLHAFDLHPHLDLDIGGYGSLSAHRPDLVAHAVRRANRQHGTDFAPEQVVVVGDTPHDVDAALRHGAVAVAVATGRYSQAELRDAGAHTVLADLSDTGAVLHTLLPQRL